MTPLRISLFLDTPMVLGERPMHLDALLAWAAVDEARATNPLVDFDAIHTNLPLEREQRDGNWCWKASYLWPNESLGMRQRYLGRKFWEEGYAEMYARGALEFGANKNALQDAFAESGPGSEPLETGAEAGPIDTQRGHNKNGSIFYAISMVPSLTAFAIGDRTRIEELLRRVEFLGKRARLEHGRVKHVVIDEDPQAHTLWQQRVVPWTIDGYVPVDSPLRPPYWNNAESVMAYRPVKFEDLAL